MVRPFPQAAANATRHETRLCDVQLCRFGNKIRFSMTSKVAWYWALFLLLLFRQSLPPYSVSIYRIDFWKWASNINRELHTDNLKIASRGISVSTEKKHEGISTYCQNSVRYWCNNCAVENYDAKIAYRAKNKLISHFRIHKTQYAVRTTVVILQWKLMSWI